MKKNKYKKIEGIYESHKAEPDNESYIPFCKHYKNCPYKNLKDLEDKNN